jgi:hypothetical protein
MDVEIEPVLQLVIYGCALSFAHEDRQKIDVCIFGKAKKK